MDLFKSGQFSGDTNNSVSLDGLVATDLRYNYRFVDWHYHENPYFSFVTSGQCRDINKKVTFDCAADSLLFHNCREPHSNTKDGGVSTAFQLEMQASWRRKFEIDIEHLPRSSKIEDPTIKLLFYNIYKQAKCSDNTTGLTIDSLLIEAIERIRGIERVESSKKPGWVKKLDDILHDNYDQPLSLYALSRELDLHWAHLSRDFPRYFRCNFSQYVRKIKVERSVAMLRKPGLTITEIAFVCGFADQSHFTRCFKEFTGATPNSFRKAIA